MADHSTPKNVIEREAPPIHHSITVARRAKADQPCAFLHKKEPTRYKNERHEIQKRPPEIRYPRQDRVASLISSRGSGIKQESEILSSGMWLPRVHSEMCMVVFGNTSG